MTPHPENIPYGECHCGCGGKTRILLSSNATKGYVKGQPARYIKGHWGSHRTAIGETAQFKIDGVYCRLIPLTKGQFAIVDAADYEALVNHKWCAVWSVSIRGFYAVRKSQTNGVQATIRMHRQILGLGPGDPKQGDHIDPMRTTENRRKNLREASHADNQHNQRRSVLNKSGFKGVSFCSWRKTRPWRAYIRLNGKYHIVGYYDTPEEAGAAWCVAAVRLHGSFARFF